MNPMEENLPLVGKQFQDSSTEGIGVVTAICYIMGVFGVVPIIVVPGALAFCGPFGFVLAAICMISAAYTAVLLGRTWLMLEIFWPHEARANLRHPYPALAEKAGGVVLRRFVSAFQNLAIFGASVPFLLIGSENLQKFLYGFTDGEFSLSFCYYIAVTTAILLPFLWIGTPKDLWHVSWIGAASIFIVVINVLIMLIRDAPDAKNVELPKIIPDWSSLAYCFAAVAFQFDIHPMVLTVQMDMKEKIRLPIALVVAFAVAFCVYGAVALTAFFLYGDKVQANILNNFSPGPLLYATMLVVAIQCLICLALGINALFQNLEETLRINNAFSWRRVIFRTAVMLLVLFVAESIPHFAVAIELVGGLLVTPYIFIFPPIFYVAIKYKTSGQLAVKDIIIGAEIVILGIVGCIGATVESGFQISMLAYFAPPCYIDIAAASVGVPPSP